MSEGACVSLVAAGREVAGVLFDDAGAADEAVGVGASAPMGTDAIGFTAFGAGAGADGAAGAELDEAESGECVEAGLEESGAGVFAGDGAGADVGVGLDESGVGAPAGAEAVPDADEADASGAGGAMEAASASVGSVKNISHPTTFGA